MRRLTPGDSLQVVQAALQGQQLPDRLAQTIVAKADGNPLFLEELAQTVKEQGTPHVPVVVPDTVQAVLAARIDRLQPDAKRLLQMAAVIGKDVALPLLHRVSGLSEEALYPALRALQNAEFLYETPAVSEVVYTFKHVLTQEVAYQSLLQRTRQQLHQHIAQVIAEHFPDMAETQPEFLAHHYTEADLAELALSYWHKAGQRAIRHSAHVEAIGHLTRGLDILHSLPETPARLQHQLTLHVTLGAPLLATKGYAAAEVGAVFMQARALCQHAEETPQLFHVLQGLWAFYLVRGELQTALELAEQLLTLAHRLHDSALTLEGVLRLGISLTTLGKFAEARQYFDQEMALYNPQAHQSHAFLYGQDPQVSCLCHLSVTLWFLGYPAQALQHSREAVSFARTLSHPYSLSWALLYAALVHTLRREWPEVQGHTEALITLCQEQGFAYRMAQARILQGWAMAQQEGQGEAALGQMQQSLEAVRATGAAVYRPYFLALLADVCHKVGQTDAGLTAVDEALDIVHKTGERVYEAGLHRHKGLLLLTLSAAHYPAAEASLQRAFTLARQQQARSLELQAALDLCQLWQRQGKGAQARQRLAETSRWFTEGFDTTDIQEARTLLEQWRRPF